MTQTPCSPPPGGCWRRIRELGGRLGNTRYGSAYEELLDQPGIGGREPAKRLVEAYYGSRNGSESYKGCAAYMDFRELLEKQSDLDAVYVATPDHWHAPISIAAMRKGKHVLCQKPMAHSIGEARRMAAVAREMKVATALPVNNPYTPTTQTISEWIADERHRSRTRSSQLVQPSVLASRN